MSREKEAYTLKSGRPRPFPTTAAMRVDTDLWIKQYVICQIKGHNLPRFMTHCLMGLMLLSLLSTEKLIGHCGPLSPPSLFLCFLLYTFADCWCNCDAFESFDAGVKSITQELDNNETECKTNKPKNKGKKNQNQPINLEMMWETKQQKNKIII